MKTWKKVLLGLSVIMLAYPFIWPALKGCRMPQSVPESWSPPRTSSAPRSAPQIVESGVIEIPAGEIVRTGIMTFHEDNGKLIILSKISGDYFFFVNGNGPDIKINQPRWPIKITSPGEIRLRGGENRAQARIRIYN